MGGPGKERMGLFYKSMTFTDRLSIKTSKLSESVIDFCQSIESMKVIGKNAWDRIQRRGLQGGLPFVEADADGVVGRRMREAALFESRDTPLGGRISGECIGFRRNTEQILVERGILVLVLEDRQGIGSGGQLGEDGRHVRKMRHRDAVSDGAILLHETIG